MPSTRGKVTPWAYPSRVCNSERFRPKAITLIRTQPGPGSGTGRSRICRFSTGPGASSTTARIVSGIGRQLALIAETSNSSVIFSLTRTPPVSRAAFQVTP
jgi:hypothetical protein